MGWFGRRKRRRLRARPFPEAQDAILRHALPIDASLPERLRTRLRQLVTIFLAEKYFEGAGGLEMTDEIRVTIAAHACLLLVGINPDEPYPGLKSIIVYPRAYFATGTTIGPGGVVTETRGLRAGESWSHALGEGGPVVLAWDEVAKGASDPDDGQNVVFHEFAHQLDDLATGMDGAPPLGDRTRYTAWARVLGDAFKDLRSELRRGHHTDIDPYGATNPAEFFAVATEMFFERPEVLNTHHRELYDQLEAFYRWSPIEHHTA